MIHKKKYDTDIRTNSYIVNVNLVIESIKIKYCRYKKIYIKIFDK